MSTKATPGAIPERELRLALVCYGGVSLAVYMHGITREILKLVRASRAYHALAEDEAAGGRYEDETRHRGELDTEAVYFKLLQQIGGTVRLRVLVDVIAGASAGGINGIMLARALAFDLSLDDHRKLWLELADVDELLDPEARASRLSKAYMRPLFWLAGLHQRRRQRRLGTSGGDPEVLHNLSLFMRSRWFEPPFCGPRMSAMMLDALEALGKEAPGSHDSLLPPGLPLELFVTTTDFWGQPQTIPLHDPPEIQEREHRHLFQFHHHFTQDGKSASTLGRDQLPSLAFAARATSSFPGAFPPARLPEMDALVQQRGLDWAGRDAFIRDQFKTSRRAGETAEDAAFIDGSVLMNKPVSVALDAVQRHPAHRQTDRRLVYLEPNPEVEREVDHEIPGFFKTIAGALSNIPRHQPIRDDLEWIAHFNEQVHLHREVADGVRAQVLASMGATLDAELTAAPDARTIARWRSDANSNAAVEAGYAYEGYTRLKVLGLLDELAVLFQHSTRGLTRPEAVARVQAWAREKRIRPMGDTASSAGYRDAAPWVRFLRAYDIRHRLRRVLLLIRRSNELYTVESVAGVTGLQVQLDRLKLRLNRRTEQLREHLNWRSQKLQRSGATLEGDHLNAFLVQLQENLDLEEFDTALDEELAAWCREVEDTVLVREILTAYFGFAQYDVLTFPMTQSHNMDALEEIKVDRIAVDDANTLRQGGARDVLKGVQFGNFGAFFSRRSRENDYLWGRLTAAERLVDIVGSAVPEAVAAGVDLAAIKKALFLAILEAETPHLGEVSELIAALEAEANGL
ncbi:patatin-like protein [Haliea sp. E1-2-M8]|uniref:patatin-like protein n=1 Tax=Haliea sp. E1-2-M8 TaxID=3064706 RepID=UPI00271FE49A|nr:patatin-like protein [Haliea sp. E1-2-M8]MDO8863731.1 patatin-like protein [Haliea sp. E1-2-M8]